MQSITSFISVAVGTRVVLQIAIRDFEFKVLVAPFCCIYKRILIFIHKKTLTVTQTIAHMVAFKP